MTRYRQQKFLPYPAEKLFALVADVEKYPAFLPWCRAAKIIEKDEAGFLASLTIGEAFLQTSFKSRVELKKDTHHITMIHQKDSNPFSRNPLTKLDSAWKFVPQEAEQGTMINFEIEFALKSSLIAKLLQPIFDQACRMMIEAFTERARQLFEADKSPNE